MVGFCIFTGTQGLRSTWYLMKLTWHLLFHFDLFLKLSMNPFSKHLVLIDFWNYGSEMEAIPHNLTTKPTQNQPSCSLWQHVAPHTRSNVILQENHFNLVTKYPQILWPFFSTIHLKKVSFFLCLQDTCPCWFTKKIIYLWWISL